MSKTASKCCTFRYICLVLLQQPVWLGDPLYEQHSIINLQPNDFISRGTKQTLALFSLYSECETLRGSELAGRENKRPLYIMFVIAVPFPMKINVM